MAITDAKLRNIKHQSLFCSELMMRIDDQIQVSSKAEYGGLPNYTRMQADIIRLRKELNDLRIMLDPWKGK